MRLPINPGAVGNLNGAIKNVLVDWFQALFPEVETPAIGGTSGITTDGVVMKCVLVRSGRICHTFITLTGTVASSSGSIPVRVSPLMPQVLDVTKGGPVPTVIGKAGIQNGTIYLPDFSGAVNVLISGSVVEG